MFLPARIHVAQGKVFLKSAALKEAANIPREKIGGWLVDPSRVSFEFSVLSSLRAALETDISLAWQKALNLSPITPVTSFSTRFPTSLSLSLYLSHTHLLARARLLLSLNLQ